MMLISRRRPFSACLLATALVPGLLRAQTPEPFQDLQRDLKPGQTAEVTDNSGRTIVGKVTALSSSSLVLTGDRGIQTFVASDVTTIKRVGPIWDGAVKGATIGLIPWLILLRGCHGCEGRSRAFVNLTGAGAVIGLLIDAAFGPKTVYRTAIPQKQIVLVPVVGRDEQSLTAALRF